MSCSTTRRSSVVPSTNSSTRQGLPWSSSVTSYTETMLGWFRRPADLASTRKRARYCSSSEPCPAADSVLIATMRPIFGSRLVDHAHGAVAQFAEDLVAADVHARRRRRCPVLGRAALRPEGGGRGGLLDHGRGRI